MTNSSDHILSSRTQSSRESWRKGIERHERDKNGKSKLRRRRFSRTEERNLCSLSPSLFSRAECERSRRSLFSFPLCLYRLARMSNWRRWIGKKTFCINIRAPRRRSAIALTKFAGPRVDTMEQVLARHQSRPPIRLVEASSVSLARRRFQRSTMNVKIKSDRVNKKCIQQPGLYVSPKRCFSLPPLPRFFLSRPLRPLFSSLVFSGRPVAFPSRSGSAAAAFALTPSSCCPLGAIIHSKFGSGSEKVTRDRERRRKKNLYAPASAVPPRIHIPTERKKRDDEKRNISK